MPKAKSGSKPDKNKDRPIHPYSRKAKKMGKQAQHFSKVESAKTARVAKLQLLAEKLLWFQEAMDDRKQFTIEDLNELVMQYRNRFEDELEQINIVQKVGKRQTQSRQHASREASIRITKEAEKNQYESCGIEAPDLVDSENLEEFRNWGGELNLIQNLKLVEVSERGVTGKGSFKNNCEILSKDDDGAGCDVDSDEDF